MQRRRRRRRDEFQRPVIFGSENLFACDGGGADAVCCELAERVQCFGSFLFFGSSIVFLLGVILLRHICTLL